ncbi:MAG: hypothetical protein AAGF78_15050 [Pseudomonadota bacterium]
MHSHSNEPDGADLRTERLQWQLGMAAVVFGILWRIAEYLFNRSLWVDEARLAINIVNRSYGELLEALDMNQAAPPLFLWIEKAASGISESELMFRVLPMIGGLLALPLFWILAQRVFRGWPAVIATWLFAVNVQMIYYSSELKPYSWDVALGLTFVLVLRGLAKPDPSRRLLVGVAALGVVAPWLSYTSVLVMAGVEAVNLVRLAMENDRRTLRSAILRRLPVYGAWLAGFILLYVLVILETRSGTGLVDAWNNRFPTGPFDIVYAFDKLAKVFYFPLGYGTPYDGIAIFAFLTGAVLLYRSHRIEFMYLMAPIAATLLASYANQYPFINRLILFLTPYFILVTAYGAYYWATKIAMSPKGALATLVATTVLVLPMAEGVWNVIRLGSTVRHDVRPAFEIAYEQFQEGDLLYVDPGAAIPYEFYKRQMPFPEDSVVVSPYYTDRAQDNFEETDLFEAFYEVENLAAGPAADHPRIWVVASRQEEPVGVFLLDNLKRHGQMRFLKIYTDAFVALFDFSAPPTLTGPEPPPS